MSCWAFIFARSGSKGLPGKNIKNLLDKPLIAYSIETALESPSIDRVIVSTDDADIADVAKSFGAEVPFLRPSELAQDASPEWLAWQHAVQWVQDHWGMFDKFISLPATSPCRVVSDIEKCIDALSDCVDIVVTATESQHNPHFNMLKVNKGGGYSRFNENEAGQEIVRRQDVDQAYNMATVAYVCRPGYILSGNSLWEGRMDAVIVKPENAIDIDTAFDFFLAELILKNRYVN
ncbi:MAG: acylneuraminate cytidylyltransferase family protein [Gammaproteobacteria bacterium]|nr:acylneuraminate cytidylyltransferase family protein [Gammaproteobacteria bacterium]